MRKLLVAIALVLLAVLPSGCVNLNNVSKNAAREDPSRFRLLASGKVKDITETKDGDNQFTLVWIEGAVIPTKIKGHHADLFALAKNKIIAFYGFLDPETMISEILDYELLKVDQKPSTKAPSARESEAAKEKVPEAPTTAPSETKAPSDKTTNQS